LRGEGIMSILVTGGAGFIGSHLCRSLIKQGKDVICVDNFRLGSREKISDLLKQENFSLYEEDVADWGALLKIFQNHTIDTVYHLAANSDIQKGGMDPTIDFHDTFLTTQSVLECMRSCSVRNLFFASTSAVYGEKLGTILREDTGGLLPVSYYGGAKLASEAFISSYAAMCEWSVVIFRFPNVIGPGLTHGVLFDFKNKLEMDPLRLQILGDGTQCKPYLYVHDLIDAIITQTHAFFPGVTTMNIGVEDSTTVTRIANIMCEEMGLSDVRYDYTGGDRGWKGDVPSFQYDLHKIKETGWKPKYSSDEAVRETIQSILHKNL